MHIVLLRLLNRSRAQVHVEGHKAWIQQGFADEVLFYVGGIRDGGAAILAAGLTSEHLLARVRDDPFVAEGVVVPEIIELDTTMSDPRLAFLVEFHGERLGYQVNRPGEESPPQTGAEPIAGRLSSEVIAMSGAHGMRTSERSLTRAIPRRRDPRAIKVAQCAYGRTALATRALCSPGSTRRARHRATRR